MWTWSMDRSYIADSEAYTILFFSGNQTNERIYRQIIHFSNDSFVNILVLLHVCIEIHLLSQILLIIYYNFANLKVFGQIFF